MSANNAHLASGMEREKERERERERERRWGAKLVLVLH
jgi:hypothetical protein